MKAGFIKDPALGIFHKFLAHSIFGKKEANKISQNELIIMWGTVQSKLMNIAGFMMTKFLECKEKLETETLALGHIITAIAKAEGLLTPEVAATLTPVTGEDYHLSSFRNAFIVEGRRGVRPSVRNINTRPCYKKLNTGGASSSRGPERVVEEDDANEEYDEMPDATGQGNQGPNDGFSMADMMNELQSMHATMRGVQTTVTTINDRMTSIEGTVTHLGTRMDNLEEHHQFLARHFGYPYDPSGRQQ